MAAGAKPSVRITAAAALLNSRPTEDSTADGWPFAGAATDGWDGTPSTDSTRGFTAKRRPVKPPVRRWFRTARPTDPGVRPAPTTATVEGRSSGSRLATSAARPRASTAAR